ncbi:cytochrome b/b6 domain-containing protein [Streptomyces sp. NPDC006552]|uniref:cytochrome b/b6 domain-containing protein n=1 Tax=Streptomyces sp. NPDC006552 TaxID=3157179 RepID=UPI0033A37140
MVTGSDAFRAAVDFTAGVLSLVSLTASVVWGLVASDRLFLTSRQRLLSQGVHRATAIASLGFLLLHVSVKVALAHVTLIGALLPFGLGVAGSGGLIGIGVLAGLLMVATGITGALRSAMASPAGLAARWRATHMLAYPAWCLALMHGLYAGRAPKTYVVVLYCLCLVAVAGAVGLRAAPRTVKRRVAARVLAFLDPGPRMPRGALRDGAEQPPPAAETPPRPASAPAGVGFAAAYRAVATPPPGAARASARPRPPAYGQRSEPVPAQRWPAPSPPPPAEAPRPSYHQRYDRMYDQPHEPSYDTPYGGVPAFDTAYGSGGSAYGSGGSVEERHGDPYPAADAPTDPLSGPFQAPASGEPWTTPYGGTQ